MEDYIRERYHDPKISGSFQSPQKFYESERKGGNTDVNLNQIKQVLSGDLAYTYNRGARRKFPRNVVAVNGLHDIWDADLAQMTGISKANDGISYILIAIDIFSRQAATEPLPNKESATVAAGFNNILQRSGVQPKALRTDAGDKCFPVLYL